MFKIGQIVYCTKSDWINGNNVTLFNPPKSGDMCVVQDTRVYEGRLLLRFRGQPKQLYYPAKHFRPQRCLFADEVIKNLTINTL